MNRVYVVRVPIPGSDLYVDLCRCMNAASAAEIVRALLNAAEGAPIRIVVESQIAN